MASAKELDKNWQKQGAGYGLPENPRKQPQPGPQDQQSSQDQQGPQDKARLDEEKKKRIRAGSEFLDFLGKYYQRDAAYFESLATPDGTKIRPILEVFNIAGPLPKDYSQPLIAQNRHGGDRPFNVRSDSVKIPKGVPLTMELAIDMALLAKANPAFANGIDVTGNAQQRAMLAAAAELVGLEVKNLGKVDPKLLAEYRQEAPAAWNQLKQEVEAFHQGYDKDDDTSIRPSNPPPKPEDTRRPGPDASGPQGKNIPPASEPVKTGSVSKPEAQPPVKKTETEPQSPKSPAQPGTQKAKTPVSPLPAAAAGTGAGTAAGALDKELDHNKRPSAVDDAMPDTGATAERADETAISPATQPAAARPSAKMVEPAAPQPPAKKLVQSPKPGVDYNDLSEEEKAGVKTALNDLGVKDGDVEKTWNDLPVPMKRNILSDRDQARKIAGDFKNRASAAAAPVPEASGETAAPPVSVVSAPQAAGTQEEPQPVPGQAASVPPAEETKTLAPVTPVKVDVAGKDSAPSSPVTEASPQETPVHAAGLKEDVPDTGTVPADVAQVSAKEKTPAPVPVKAPQQSPLPAAAEKEDAAPAKDDFTDAVAKGDKDAGKTAAQILAGSGINPAPHRLEDIYSLVKVRVIEDNDASLRHVEDIIGFDNNIPGSKKIARVILKALEADGVVVRDRNNLRKVAMPQPPARPDVDEDDEEAGFGLPSPLPVHRPA